jgi:hypothetical protein
VDGIVDDDEPVGARRRGRENQDRRLKKMPFHIFLHGNCSVGPIAVCQASEKEL